MPEISTSTRREQYTIDGDSYNIPLPYNEGHVLTAGEASQLNQVFAENIRNNFAQRAKKAKEAGSFDLEVFQSQLNEYVEEYEMGVRSGGGGRTSDPVQTEAMSIARDAVRRAIVKKGLKLADVSNKQITEKARELLAGSQGDLIRDTARARVAEVREIADIELGDLSPASEGSQPAPVGKGKSKAA